MIWILYLTIMSNITLGHSQVLIGTEGTTLITWIIIKVMIITLSSHYDETSKHL